MAAKRSGERIPVIVGVGQVANKDASRLVTAAELALEAVDRAVDDAGAKLLEQLDALFAPPSSVFTERSLADELGEALGIDPARRTGSSFSGASPLKLLAEASEQVTSGRARVAVVAGAIADASVKQARVQGIEPVGTQAAPWSQGSRGRRDDRLDDVRGRHLRGAESGAGVTGPSDIFALIESAFAAAAGRGPAEQRVWLGSLMAPFTEVAASRPELAWFPTARQPHELSDVTPDNRLVAEPYTKLMNAFPTVDLAAAVFVTSEAHADALGIAPELRVYPWSTAQCAEIAPPSGRPSIHQSAAMRAAIEHALRNAGQGVDEISSFDLYSCFPAAVQLSLDVLGIDPTDPRRLTLTGGLPYFGGPGANYATHAIACAVERCRTAADETSLVVGLGGAPSDFAASVFAAVPPASPWYLDRCADTEEAIESTRVPIELGREGIAVVDAMTVVHHRTEGPMHVPLVASFDDGVRTGARAADPELARALSGVSLVGEKVRITARDGVSTFTPI